MKPENFGKMYDWLCDIKDKDDISVDATAFEIAKLVDAEVVDATRPTDIIARLREEISHNPAILRLLAPIGCSSATCAICHRDIYQAHDGTWYHSIFGIDHAATLKSESESLEEYREHGGPERQSGAESNF